MCRSIFERELLPAWRNRPLTEITSGDLRAHCLTIVDRGVPATAIYVQDIVKQIYGFAEEDRQCELVVPHHRVRRTLIDFGPNWHNPATKCGHL